jgi:hypothetical protein
METRQVWFSGQLEPDSEQFGLDIRTMHPHGAKIGIDDPDQFRAEAAPWLDCESGYARSSDVPSIPRRRGTGRSLNSPSISQRSTPSSGMAIGSSDVIGEAAIAMSGTLKGDQ